MAVSFRNASISATGYNWSCVKTQVSPTIMTLILGYYVPGPLPSAFSI